MSRLKTSQRRKKGTDVLISYRDYLIMFSKMTKWERLLKLIGREQLIGLLDLPPKKGR